MADKRKPSIIITLVLLLVVVGGGVLIYCFWWNNHPQPGHVRDEALQVGRDAASFQAADEDYFQAMDQTKDGMLDLVKLAPEPIKEKDPNILVKGRNTWMVWSAGNDRLWDTLIYKSAGALDFLKLLSSHPELLKIDPRFSRDQRWQLTRAILPDEQHRSFG